MEIVVEKGRLQSLLSNTLTLKGDSDDYLFAIVFYENMISVEFHRVICGIIEEGKILNESSFTNESFPYLMIRVWDLKEVLDFIEKIESDHILIKSESDAIWCDAIEEVFYPLTAETLKR